MQPMSSQNQHLFHLNSRSTSFRKLRLCCSLHAAFLLGMLAFLLLSPCQLHAQEEKPKDAYQAQ